ncbi:MAG: Htaa domain protein, partial [Pseudomonadota bacterium]
AASATEADMKKTPNGASSVPSQAEATPKTPAPKSTHASDASGARAPKAIIWGILIAAAVLFILYAAT